MRLETPCPLAPKTMEGDHCTTLQRHLLNTRKRPTGTSTEEDRWREMYTILFPNTEIVPSPCESSHTSLYP